MNLKPCPACSRHVRTDESSCPFCEARLSPRQAAGLVAAALGAAVLSGCPSQDRQPAPVYGAPQPPPSASPEQPPEPTPAPEASPDGDDPRLAAPMYGAPPPDDRIAPPEPEEPPVDRPVAPAYGAPPPAQPGPGPR